MGKVSDIIIDRFLKDVEEKQSMPWQRPYECYNAFNYFSMQTYRGINRLLLPFGEYISANQINEYNKKHKEDFRFQKGIKWYPVVFFKHDEQEVDPDYLLTVFPDADLNAKPGTFYGTDGVWKYVKTQKGYERSRSILRYTDVADRTHFKNSKGEMLPSRIDTGEVVITKSEPMNVINSYVAREEGLKVIWDSADIPCYSSTLDTVELNPHHKDEDSWYSTAFHEFAHSTGHKSRLDRVGVHKPKGISSEERKDLYAVEECIAEITASLCCAECGVYDFETSCTKEYDNSVAYVQGWKKRIKDWGKDFIYIVSQADKAFNYILNYKEEI